MHKPSGCEADQTLPIHNPFPAWNQARTLRAVPFFLDLRKAPCTTIDGCPRLRFIRARATSILEEWSRAASPEARAAVAGDAADLAHIIGQVIAPMAAQLHGSGFAKHFADIAGRLQRLASLPAGLHDGNFPDDAGRQLILDRLDAIEGMLLATLHRRQARRHEAGETEAA
jgi:hypothetical protein